VILCAYDSKRTAFSILVVIQIDLEIALSVVVALTYLYFGIIIDKFVEEFLPTGMVPKNSIQKTRLLFFSFFGCIILRSVII
jgi:hypothetical protein